MMNKYGPPPDPKKTVTFAETNISIEPANSNSSVDHDRRELLWESREERLIVIWKNHCQEKSKRHGVKARRKKLQYTIISIPAILIPLIMTGLNTILQEYMYVNIILMMLVSILTGINGFLNLGGQTAQNFQFEGLYSDLMLNIDQELCKPKSHRVACDVYLERVKCGISKLDLSAPNL
jgi:hypothetical protein